MSTSGFVPAVAAVALDRLSGASLILYARLAKPFGIPGRLSGVLFGRGADAVIRSLGCVFIC